MAESRDQIAARFATLGIDVSGLTVIQLATTALAMHTARTYGLSVDQAVEVGKRFVERLRLIREAKR